MGIARASGAREAARHVSLIPLPRFQMVQLPLLDL